jgi:hypothetical protein
MLRYQHTFFNAQLYNTRAILLCQGQGTTIMVTLQTILLVIVIILALITYESQKQGNWIGLTVMLLAGLPILLALVFVALSWLWLPFFWIALPFVVWVIFVLVINRK